MPDPRLVERLRAGGVVQPEVEAGELSAAATGDALEALVRRRLAGEPLPRLLGRVDFGGRRLHLAPGVYIPRWTSEAPARVAADRLPPDGTAVDACTGSGAIAAVLAASRPDARVVATDLDRGAVACARRNGVEAYVGDLLDGVPPELRGDIDVVVAVPPFVPAGELGSLPPEVRANEPRVALDGGPDGLDLARRLVDDAAAWLRSGGSLVVEVGRSQVPVLASHLDARGYRAVTTVVDDDGDACGVAAVAPT